ncbi:MAG: helix-turn-helix transcriptional regulator [Bacteroidales bacterium]|nr:helix-turn-helix transcriptional regulator [Bacteroidales bacterium]
MDRIIYNLKKRRKELGYTKLYVAQKAGITPNSMVNIEHGKCCSLKSLLAICDVLKLRLELVSIDLSITSDIDDYRYDV